MPSATLQCPQCQFENAGTAKFCVDCGTKLSSVCPSCGIEVDPTHKFCHSCGHQLDSASTVSPEPPASANETGTRRPVTVLFADISGFTTLSGKLDAEDSRA